MQLGIFRVGVKLERKVNYTIFFFMFIIICIFLTTQVKNFLNNPKIALKPSQNFLQKITIQNNSFVIGVYTFKKGSANSNARCCFKLIIYFLRSVYNLLIHSISNKHNICMLSSFKSIKLSFSCFIIL